MRIPGDLARLVRARSSRHCMESNRSRTAKYIGGAKARNIKNAGIRATPSTNTHHSEGKAQAWSRDCPQTTPKTTPKRGCELSRFRDCPRFRDKNTPAEGASEILFRLLNSIGCAGKRMLPTPPAFSPIRHSRRTGADCPLCPIRRIVPSPSFATLI